MKKIVIFSALAAVAVVASAQEQGRVLSATPIIQQVGVPQQVCGNETVYSGNRTTGAGAVIGAIAGGAVGNTIGKGSGRAAATAIGVLGGAVVGNQIEGNGQPQYSWFIWAIGGILYAALVLVVKMALRKQNNKCFDRLKKVQIILHLF